MSTFTIAIRTRTVDHSGCCTDSENEPEVDLCLKHVTVEKVDMVLGTVITDEATLKEKFGKYFVVHQKPRGYCTACYTWDDIQEHASATDVVMAMLIN